jgi:trehalose 6-phosphate synthase
MAPRPRGAQQDAGAGTPSPSSQLEAAARRLLGGRRLILAANRGPINFSAAADGSLRPRRGSGGVVTALSQVGGQVPLTWIAAAMGEADRRAAKDPALLDAATPGNDLRLRFATVPRATFDAAYNVIANPLLWFLQHEMWNLPERPMVGTATMRAWHEGYVPLNEAFARAVLEEVPRGDERPRIMLHDYHLYLAAEPIRAARPEAVISHFTHIPWPPSSIWQVMPPVIREGICRGLLANDVVGFHTARYAHNFLRSVESFIPDVTVDYRRQTVVRHGRMTYVRAYPISIDVAATRRAASSRAARRRAAELLAGCAEQVIVRVDRMEPSKNILRGFAAFETLLDQQPSLRGRVTFLAFLVPSRTSIREYRDYGRQVTDAADRLNARFARAGRAVVRIFYENNYAQALAGLSIADLVLVNPLIDGMNLVAKEAVVVSERDAVLVLSETAGAYDQMADGVLTVAPADLVGTAEAMSRGLAMSREERRDRLARLRTGVEREDVRWWLRRQFEDLGRIAAATSGRGRTPADGRGGVRAKR